MKNTGLKQKARQAAARIGLLRLVDVSWHALRINGMRISRRNLTISLETVWAHRYVSMPHPCPHGVAQMHFFTLVCTSLAVIRDCSVVRFANTAAASRRWCHRNSESQDRFLDPLGIRSPGAGSEILGLCIRVQEMANCRHSDPLARVENPRVLPEITRKRSEECGSQGQGRERKCSPSFIRCHFGGNPREGILINKT